MGKSTRARRARKGKVAKRAVPASKSPKPNGPTRAYQQTGREGKVPVAGFFEPRVRRRLKIMAAKGETTVQALLGEAINDLFAKHGKPESAT